MKKVSDWLQRRLIDLLSNEKLSLELIESFAYVIAYAIEHEFHELSEKEKAALLAAINGEDWSDYSS